MSKSLWVLHHYIRNRLQVVVRTLAIALLASKCRQPQQNIDGNTITGRGSVIHDILRAADQRLVITARIKESVILLIGKQRDRFIHQPARFNEPAWLKTCLVQCQQSICQEDVIFQVTFQARSPILIRAQ